jgi:hypothetical protein
MWFARTRTTTSVLLLCAASGISPQANAADLAAYRRSDGDGSVVYRGLDTDIHEIYLCAVNDSECRKGGDYHSWDPSPLTSAAPAAGDPAAYICWDNLNTMVYRGSDNHIYELTTPGGSIWQTADLSALADAPSAAGDPAACRRYDPGGEIEQIQLLLGHASIQTTERYLGTRQNLADAPNDGIKIKLPPAA